MSVTVATDIGRDAGKRSFRWKLFGGRPDPILLAAMSIILLAILCAFFPGLIAPYNPNQLGPHVLQGPSSSHWLGTDEYGRDILSRIIHGARIELVISVSGVLIAVLIGVPVGLISGFRGGWIDALLMRVQDALLAFPAVLFAILVVAALGASQQSIILTVGVVFLPRFARLVRGTVLVLKEEEFVTASRAVGAGDARLLFRHILPNAMPSILVQITLTMAVAILVEAGLSYLGLGVQPPTATWGTMLKSAQSYPAQAPWYVLAPGLCIFVLVLALNTFGDGLRDRLDPRVRKV
jgi:peptide/nickel transport system permease protein